MAKRSIIIGGTTIDEQSAPYLIAEIGINHNGEPKIAEKLIDAAYACGWHAVKFQKREPDIAVPEAQKSVPRDTPWGKMTYLEYKKRIEFGKKEFDDIEAYCARKPMDWSASPWDMPSLEFLLRYDIPFIKVASATITNEALVKSAAESGKPVILSTGMSTWDEIDCAVNLLEKHGHGDYILLHTNSAYPADNKDLNLNMMATLKDRYGCLVGYSGHERGVTPSIIAAALGACVVERHVTLSRDMWGTDQKASLEIQEMAALAREASSIRCIMGDGEKKLSEKELEVRKKLRN